MSDHLISPLNDLRTIARELVPGSEAAQAAQRLQEFIEKVRSKEWEKYCGYASACDLTVRLEREIKRNRRGR